MSDEGLAAPAPAPVRASLIYVGPAGQDSPTFGPLVAGQRYQTDEAFAAYLVERHPEYWQRPTPVTAKAPAPKE